MNGANPAMIDRLRVAIKRRLVALGLLSLPLPFWPAWWCGQEADAVFEARSFSVFAPLVAEVTRNLDADIGVNRFQTGSWQYDGEWNLVTWQATAVGLCQLILRFPEQKASLAPLVERALDRLLATETRRFDTRSWGEDALAGLDGNHGHLAFLGYANVALSLWRSIEPQNRFADWNDRMSEALEKRFAASQLGLVETYPREVYPVDNTPALASLGLWHRATGRGDQDLLKRLLQNFRERYRDSGSGLLFQCVRVDNGEPLDKPRASGTAFAAFWLSLIDPTLSRELYQSLKESCQANFFGFTAFTEYPPSVEPGTGDVDSGPVIFGLSFSGTAFG
ncbi:MAG TPA: hypothetical protein PKO06_24530, partial [Candidatus Ozemobacteraceae bacterium]|nr:hypothetical protein [Candidatus Ozemobacteraceae bacterium]